jgi:hypothetical protein
MERLYYACMTVNSAVRDVPEKVRGELTARAASQALSMQELLRVALRPRLFLAGSIPANLGRRQYVRCYGTVGPRFRRHFQHTRGTSKSRQADPTRGMNIISQRCGSIHEMRTAEIDCEAPRHQRTHRAERLVYAWQQTV